MSSATKKAKGKVVSTKPTNKTKGKINSTKKTKQGRNKENVFEIILPFFYQISKH
jgi:hypothetical protein